MDISPANILLCILYYPLYRMFRGTAKGEAFQLLGPFSVRSLKATAIIDMHPTHSACDWISWKRLSSLVEVRDNFDWWATRKGTIEYISLSRNGGALLCSRCPISYNMTFSRSPVSLHISKAIFIGTDENVHMHIHSCLYFNFNSYSRVYTKFMFVVFNYKKFWDFWWDFRDQRVIYYYFAL